jgi:hypothetical protein
MINSFKKYLSLILVGLFVNCSDKETVVPEFLIGQFTDDYNIEYELTEDLFILKPNNKFHILTWNTEEMYFIAQNDSSNAYDPNLYSKIDWVKFDEMEPFIWGFCISAYNAPTADSAKAVDIADRSAPKTGCNGYPFSRMRPLIP